MTNILKDVWEDRGRGACWLPQDVFARHGIILAQVSSEPFDPRFGDGYRELVGMAHAHLRNALNYTLIPSRETGIRRSGRSGLPSDTGAQDRAQSTLHGRRAGQGVENCGRHDPLVHGCGRAQRRDAAAIVQDGSPRFAACAPRRLAQTAARARPQYVSAAHGLRRSRNSTEAGHLPGNQPDARGDIARGDVARGDCSPACGA